MKKYRKSVRVEFSCTVEEAEMLAKAAKGYRSISAYIRQRIFKNGKSLLNPVEFIRVLDEATLEMKRVGVNINQFAKRANQKKEISNSKELDDYNKLLSEYLEIEKKINITLRKIMNM